MVDEKKIEETAKKHMLKQFYSDNDWDFPCDISDIKNQCMNDFKAGINWFLDNLWHDASEEPKENSTVVLVTKFDNEPYTAFYSHSFEAFNGEGVFLIKDADHNDDCYFFPKDIDKWFYFDDLLKGGK